MEANHTGGNASIHTTCECSDRYIALIIADSGIPIHAAREGGDHASVLPAWRSCIFQSTPPVKAATCNPAAHKIPEIISIHAAREGGDFATLLAAAQQPEFQSTPPVKAATAEPHPDDEAGQISIHAAREGGDDGRRHFGARRISIHAAREGGDNIKGILPSYCRNFNPRRP